MKTKRNFFQTGLLCAVVLHTFTSGAQTVTKIAAGGNHSLFLKSDGSLWAMGYNGYGELGDGSFNNTNRPKQIIASNVTTIAGGDYHSLYLKDDGSLWVMGDNSYGQLGDDIYSPNPFFGLGISTPTPEMIVASNATAIAGGTGDSLFLKNDGSLWGMGWNTFGELGIGSDIWTNHPVPILASNVAAIATANSYPDIHCLLVKSNGSLWGMGADDNGELGKR